MIDAIVELGMFFGEILTCVCSISVSLTAFSLVLAYLDLPFLSSCYQNG
jgi:hypothetical protein